MRCYYFSCVMYFGGCEYRLLSRGRVSLERDAFSLSHFTQSKKYVLRCFSPVKQPVSLLFSFAIAAQLSHLIQVDNVAPVRRMPCKLPPIDLRLTHGARRGVENSPTCKTPDFIAEELTLAADYLCMLIGSCRPGSRSCRRYTQVDAHIQTTSAELISLQDHRHCPHRCRLRL